MRKCNCGPWSFLTSCQNGSSRRLSLSSCSCSAQSPDCIPTLHTPQLLVASGAQHSELMKQAAAAPAAACFISSECCAPEFQATSSCDVYKVGMQSGDCALLPQLKGITKQTQKLHSQCWNWCNLTGIQPTCSICTLDVTWDRQSV